MEFASEFRQVGVTDFPDFSGTRVMMLPFLLEDPKSLPDYLEHYQQTIADLRNASPIQQGVAYLTIDEKQVSEGHTHRRPGLHVDGVYRGQGGGWGGGGPWGSNGFLTTSNFSGCRAWNQNFKGEPGPEGECEHLRSQLLSPTGETLKPGFIYWVDGMCVHESFAQLRNVQRTFVRLSLPNNSPWFEGYTENPKGILPTGPILPRRAFMDM